MVCQCGEERAVDNELTKKDFHALLVAGMCVIGMCWMSRAWSEEMPMLYLTKAPEEAVAIFIALLGFDVYRELRSRGWTGARYERWLARTLHESLLHQPYGPDGPW